MRTVRGRRALLGAAWAILAAGVAARSSSSSAQAREPSRRRRSTSLAWPRSAGSTGRSLDQDPATRRRRARERDRAVTRALPLVKAQQSEVQALEAPHELRTRLARWFDLQDRRLGMLERALRAARRQDFRALSVAYVDFILAGPKTARLGSAIGIPHPPC